MRVLKDSNLAVKKIALVHGEEEQSLAFAEYLRGAGYNVVVPLLGQSIVV
jgi:metallo-beta-lactamase family protein